MNEILGIVSNSTFHHSLRPGGTNTEQEMHLP